VEDDMAVAMLAEIPGLTQEEYEHVVTKVNQMGSPIGALFHAGGPVENGYRVIEVWQDREAADTFYNSRQYQDAVAGLTTHPEIIMTWDVLGVDDGCGWRQTA
jgi:quinol monooxygenase YgiN